MSIPNLKPVLIVDAITCVGVVALCLGATTFVANALGLPANIVTIAGLICVAAALPMFLAAAQKVPNAALVKLIALGNIGWVAASFAVVAGFAGQMTGVGIIVAIAQAFAVLGFAIVEWKGVAARFATV